MYRIEASCRKHVNHDQLVKLVSKHKWNISSENRVVQINGEFASMREAKLAKQILQADIQKLEREIKPELPFGMIFSNAFWVGASVDNDK